MSVSYSQPAEAWHRRVFHGLAQIIVQGGTKPGDIKLRASSEGLESVGATVHATQAEYRGLVEAGKS